MNVAELLDNLTQQGVQLRADNDRLRIHAPKGILTPAIRLKLAERKAEILTFLQASNGTASDNDAPIDRDISLSAIGRLIGGICDKSQSPIIDPTLMAKKLKVTFRPLPNGYQEETILKFRQELERQFQNYGVQIEPWEAATKEFTYEINIPFTNWHKILKTRVVKAGISALIDVERNPTLLGKVKIWIAEKLYQFYSRFIWKNQKLSVSKIAQFISWSEDNIFPLEDPTNTQAIAITNLDKKLTNPHVPYQQKIPVGINTLIRTFSEIVIGVSPTHLSILNMNLSDSMFSVEAIDEFVLNSLIPKIYVPILPLPMSRFEIGEYNQNQSEYAVQLVKLGQELAPTGLLPSGFKINDVIKRKSHRDIVDWMANGRTGVSYGFVAYAESPQYIGDPEISETEWENLSAVAGFNRDELRQNQIGRRYLKTKIGNEFAFKQLPDIWLLSSRSGSNKTNLNLATDILRIGLQDKLLLQLPQGIDATVGDIKPSYDIYVMVAIALATALYAPDLIKNGAPIVHFHGYPSINWFSDNNEYCTGVHNPSVPCGTYESGVFNFLGIHNLVNQYGSNITLASLIEPDHGTNIIASDLDYLVARLKTGIDRGQVELGGKNFPSLKQNIAISKPLAISH
jgi:TubC N-terminal docking domain